MGNAGECRKAGYREERVAPCGASLHSAADFQSRRPAPPLSGSFALSRLNGRPLPDTEVVLPPAHPGGATCTVLGTSGTLVLNRIAGTFIVTLNTVNSCGGGEYVFLTEAGTYLQQDTVLSMSEPFPDHVETLTGSQDSQNVVIHGVYHVYTFARP
jgi:hypothetical protein